MVHPITTNGRLDLLVLSNNLLRGLLHAGLLLNLDGRDDDAELLVGKVLEADEVLGPAITKLAELVKVNITSFTGATGKDLLLTSGVLLLEHGVRAPDDAHTGTTTSLDTGNGVFKDEALLGSDGLLAGGERIVDGLEGENENVGERLATTGSQTGIVTEDATVRGEDGEKLLEVVGLDAEVAQMGAGSKSDMNSLGLLIDLVLVCLGSSGAILDLPVTSAAKVAEKVGDTRKRLRVRKQLLLQGRVLGEVLVGSDGELGPVVEDLVGGGTGTTLKFGLDGPGEGSFAVLFEDHVDTLSVDVLGVKKETVHVKETSPNGRKVGARSHCERREKKKMR